ncbi:MAG: hypothetical protein ACXIUM_02780 [Wenzhouxiangella sp.]
MTYHPCHAEAAASGGPIAKVTVQAQAGGEAYILLSPSGQDIKRAIRTSVQGRQPVGYQREFLDDYQSNRSFYLSTENRQRLLAIGAPPGGERPAGTHARTIVSRLLIDLSWNSSRLEGNIARYRLRPSEFQLWLQQWH